MNLDKGRAGKQAVPRVIHFPHGHPFSIDWTFPVALLWGLLVLVSFIGWGDALGRWLVTRWEDEDAGWALTAAWGMAVFLILAGVLMMLSLFSATFVALFLAIGWALFVRRLFSAKGRVTIALPPSFGLKIALLALGLFCALGYASATARHDYNPFDDFAAYFPLAKMLLDTGTLLDPFSFRLMASLGGQEALSTTILAFLPWKYAHLLDAGVCTLIMLGLAQGMVRGNSQRAWVAQLLLVAIALRFQIPRSNIGSELTGSVLFLALLRSFDLVTAQRVVGYRASLLLAVVMTATTTLRCHFLFAAGLLGAGFYTLRFWENKESRSEILREAAMTLGLVVVCSLPWWIVTYRSSGAFLYPLIKGTQRTDLEIYQIHHSLSQTLGFIGGFFVHTNFLLLFLPVALIKPGHQRRMLLICGSGILLISIACVSHLTNGLYLECYRYVGPMGLAFFLYTLGILAQQYLAGPVVRSAWRTVAFTLVGLAILCWFIRMPLRYELGVVYHAVLGPSGLTGSSKPTSTDDADRDYTHAFAQIPPNSKVLIALDYPFLLDYHAHRIFSIDDAGSASPPPGFPYFQGAEPVRQYLLSQGIRYIAHAPFDQATGLQSRSQQTWLQNNWSENTRYAARYEFDFFDNVDQLARSSRILYDSPTIQVIDLGN